MPIPRLFTRSFPLALLFAVVLVSNASAAWDGVPKPSYRGEGYRGEGVSRFITGGVGFWGDLGAGMAWSIAGGLECPVNSWAVVPRVALEGADGEGGGGLLVRGTVGGRITTLLASHASYLEGGFGVMNVERNGSTDLFFTPSTRSRSIFSPVFTFVGGTMSDPNERPSLLLEAEITAPLDKDAPGSVIGRVGIRF